MNEQDRSLVISYLAVRRAIGALGTLLPSAVVLVSIIGGEHELRLSISNYYYSPARDIFVGTLCSIGILLICYRGYDLTDRGLTTAAGFAAIGVAMFPVEDGRLVGGCHLTSAGVLFTAMAALCLLQFKKGSGTIEKPVYRICGYTIMAMLASIFISEAVGSKNIFWQEMLAIETFGFAWLVKGRMLGLIAK